MQRIPFYQHDLGQAELDAITEVFAGPILTTGETVEHFEDRFAAYLGCKHVVGVTSCTAGLHLALAALNIGPGDEVITTPMTFVATASAIMQAGATPVFVDVDPDTGLIDPTWIESAISRHTRAIIPVHLYGQMADMRAIHHLANRHGLHVIEDAAHCIEGERDGIRPGELGAAACFSFYATKNLTCGEGGAIATNDTAMAHHLRSLRLHGMTKTAFDRSKDGYEHWDMKSFGWKYNMDNIQAAMLLPQMDRLEDNWHKRSLLAQRYMSRLSDAPGIYLPIQPHQSRHAWHLFPIWVEHGRDELLHRLHSRGVEVMVNYRAVHLLSYLRESMGLHDGDFPVAERIGDMTLSLPFYPKLSLDEADHVATVVQESLDENPGHRTALFR